MKEYVCHECAPARTFGSGQALGGHRSRMHRVHSVGNTALEQKRAELAARTVDPVQALERWQRRREPSPSQVDTEIEKEIESLKARAITPTAEPVDEELAAREDEERRDARRKDNLRRMRNPVLVQRTGDAILFKDDLQVRETSWGSGRDT
jgi:hypothetical protein